MNCSFENREERLMDYVSGSLESAQAALFEKHLEICPACSEFVSGQKAVWDALDVFEPVPVSANFDQALYRQIANTSWWTRFLNFAGSPFRAPAFLRQGLPLMAAAALAVAALVVWERPATAPVQQPTVSAEGPSPDQVQRALDDMEMLNNFNHLVVADSAKSKM
jgi:anti-sigma factor RsiW